MLYFNHQHLGTFQSSLPYKKFLPTQEKLDTLRLTLHYIPHNDIHIIQNARHTYNNTYIQGATN